MKQELIKNLLPIIDKFADDILSGFSDLGKIRKQLINEQRKYEDLNENKEKELKEIRDSKTEGRKEFDKKLTELDNAKQDFLLKLNNYEDLINDMKGREKKTEENLAKSEIEFIRAKEVRSQTDETKEEAEKLKNDYELKLNSLQTDSAKIVEENQKDVYFLG